jgi:hypothetical protein
MQLESELRRFRALIGRIKRLYYCQASQLVALCRDLLDIASGLKEGSAARPPKQEPPVTPVFSVDSVFQAADQALQSAVKAETVERDDTNSAFQTVEVRLASYPSVMLTLYDATICDYCSRIL